VIISYTQLKEEIIMGSKGRHNVKKPKQAKSKAAPAPETKKK
jgi:hypothetical protein